MDERILPYKEEIRLLDSGFEEKETAGSEITLPAKKKRISIYLLLTISAALFVIGFSAADLGVSVLGGKAASSFAARTVSDVLQGSGEKLPKKMGEDAARSVLGIPETTKTEDTHADAITDEPSNEDGGTEKLNDTNTDENHDETGKSGEEATRYPIIKTDLCQSNPDAAYISNETGYKPDTNALLLGDGFLPPDDGALKAGDPLVLIIHTHGTEAYSEEGAEYYTDDGSDLARSPDTEKNVVEIGRVMAEVLNGAGIKTLHCTVMHDEKSYQESYSRAASTIKSYLAKYPTIKYVFDVHRDAILRSDGALVKGVTELDGKSTAQVMTVVGSNYKGADFPDWENHLAFALRLRKNLNDKYDSLCRPVYLRGAAYNEQYTPGSLLLEIGSSGNTLSEAKRAAKLVAEALAEIILDNK